MTNYIYIQNKYLNWYNSIINNAIYQKRYKGKIYYENHHITPKSFGGTNDSNNLVLLTAREHYLCHYLLTKFTTKNYKRKMIFAFNFMNVSSSNQKRYFNSKLYELNKIKYSHVGMSNVSKQKMSLSQIGKIKSTSSKNKISGKNSYHFSGYYITPWGKFETSTQAEINNVIYQNIQKWCKKSNKIINKAMISQGKYLQSLKENPLGKSFKEIGFDFEPI